MVGVYRCSWHVNKQHSSCSYLAWAKNLLKRMDYVKRKACSTAKTDVEDFDKVKEEFLLEIRTLLQWMKFLMSTSSTLTRRN